MHRGFYFSNNSGYGIKAWREVKGYTNVYMDFELGTKFPVLLGKKLWVTFNMNNPLNESENAVRAMVRALRSRWGKVIALELGDELKWSAPKINGKAAMVREVILEEGLPQKPLGITFHQGQIFDGDAWRAVGLDWLGLEAYLEERPGETWTQAAGRMRLYIAALLKRVGSAKKIVLVQQGYNRNGAWKDVGTLCAIQKPTVDAARALGDRLLMLAIFAYVRGTPEKPVGTRYIPELKAEIKRLLRAA
jgi:hypothetical protein